MFKYRAGCIFLANIYQTDNSVNPLSAKYGKFWIGQLIQSNSSIVRLVLMFLYHVTWRDAVNSPMLPKMSKEMSCLVPFFPSLPWSFILPFTTTFPLIWVINKILKIHQSVSTWVCLNLANICWWKIPSRKIRSLWILRKKRV